MNQQAIAKNEKIYDIIDHTAKERAIAFKNWWNEKILTTPVQEMLSDDEEYEIFLFQNNTNR